MGIGLISEEEINVKLNEKAIHKNLEGVLEHVTGKPADIYLTKRNGEYKGHIVGIILKSDQKYVYVENDFRSIDWSDPSMNYLQRVFKGMKKVRKDRIKVIELLTERQRYIVDSTS